MEPDRIEGLVVQVLEETRAFRQEMRDELAPLKSDVAILKNDVAVLKSDVGLMKLAIIQNSRDIRDLRDEFAGVRSEMRATTDRLDAHERRLAKLEGAAE